MSAVRVESRRYCHERTGEAMPAYVLGSYVIEKGRRDYSTRGKTIGIPVQDRELLEWWEVRRQGSKTYPGVTVGSLLFWAKTMRECRAWVEGQA